MLWDTQMMSNKKSQLKLTGVCLESNSMLYYTQCDKYKFNLRKNIFIYTHTMVPTTGGFETCGQHSCV